MQRDETELLEPWLRYHGYLFGYENLVVLDHGSRDPEVTAVLGRYRYAGVTVERLAPTAEQYARKGEHMARIIRTLDEGSDYDFAVPMDCDEFLVLCDRNDLIAGRTAIDAAFDGLIGEVRALGIEMLCNNVVRRPGWFGAGVVSKGFLPARSVLDVDHGNHAIRSHLAEGTRNTSFCYLHFHNKPLSILLDQARRKLDGRVDHSDPVALENYRGPGDHLTRYFFMNDEQYETEADGVLSFSAPDFARRTTALGIHRMLFGRTVTYDHATTEVALPGQRSTPFSSDRYLAANGDLRKAGVDPLHHYLRHGWREGRSLGPPDRAEVPPMQAVR